jgi:hypothetical protein
MKFVQLKNNWAELQFTDEEIKILQEKKKFVFAPENLKAFMNTFMYTFHKFQMGFEKKLMNQNTDISDIQGDGLIFTNDELKYYKEYKEKRRKENESSSS